MASRTDGIGGSTRVVGVIGDPISHTRSPAMHNAAFRALGLDWVYLPFRVAAGDVAAAIEGARALGLRGLNVTVPHKEAVLPHLDRLSERARACRAVNTIVVHDDGTLSGDNTDVPGLERALLEAGLPRRAGDVAVLLGAGGSARAAVLALGARARTVVIAARRPERARALARELRRATSAELRAIDLADLAPGRAAGRILLERAAVVANATSLGMHGEPFVPLDVAATPGRCLFYDLVYTRKRTPFLAPAARLRRPVANGLGMLLHQGAAAFTAWTGKRAPVEVMRRALVRAGR
jgi:shikimate dehydrogenase